MSRRDNPSKLPLKQPHPDPKIAAIEELDDFAFHAGGQRGFEESNLRFSVS